MWWSHKDQVSFVPLLLPCLLLQCSTSQCMQLMYRQTSIRELCMQCVHALSQIERYSKCDICSDGTNATDRRDHMKISHLLLETL